MMKIRFVLSVGVGLALLTAPSAVRATILNGSFESWNLVGWSFQSDVGSIASDPFSRNAGQARTVSSWGEPFGLNPLKTAADGGRFLVLNSRANANFLGNDTYDFSVSQTFNLTPGVTVSGMASFFSGDSQPNDNAWVRVLDSEGNLVASLWEATSGPTVSLLSLPQPEPAWTSWSWSTGAPGNFTLQLGMTTTGANNDASCAFFDSVKIAPQAIPEPSAMVLGLLGSFAVILVRNRRH